MEMNSRYDKATSDKMLEFVIEAVDYSPISGRMYWKQSRPLHHYKTAAAHKMAFTRASGKPVGSDHHGYLRFSVAIDGKSYHLYCHRVAWALVTGSWPEQQVDHINGCGKDNRWLNLRAAAPQENARNCPPRKHNKVGMKWVRLSRNRFEARATINSKTVHFGRFDTAEEAHAAAANALASIHGEFIRTGSAA